MALLPCSRGPHRNLLRNSNYYVAFGSGADLGRWLLRLCPTHAAVVNDNLAEYEVLPDDLTVGADGPAADCLTCGEPITEAGAQLFVTAYPAKNERKDYWASVHENCRLPQCLQKPDVVA